MLTILEVFWFGFWIFTVALDIYLQILDFYDVLPTSLLPPCVSLVILNPTWFFGNFNSWRATLFFMLCRLLINLGSFFLLCLTVYVLTLSIFNTYTQHNPNPANVGPGPSGDN
jgi:hypothetical protein